MLMGRKSTLPPDAPVWLTEDRGIDEMTFCCSFLEAHPTAMATTNAKGL